VNFENKCPFWDARMICDSNKCGVWECDQDEVPLIYEDKNMTNAFKICSDSPLNTSLSSKEKAILDINSSESDWMHNMEYDQVSVYVNLIENSEGYTAFNGSHVWKAIYEENCFNSGKDATCSEEQMLFKLVSGVQSNINMHISHYYSHKGSDKQFENLDVYYQRVGAFEERLKNMHFVYSFVL
jgi:hypothetical protein